MRSSDIESECQTCQESQKSKVKSPTGEDVDGDLRNDKLGKSNLINLGFKLIRSGVVCCGAPSYSCPRIVGILTDKN